jgi:hypothetical protein
LRELTTNGRCNGSRQRRDDETSKQFTEIKAEFAKISAANNKKADADGDGEEKALPLPLTLPFFRAQTSNLGQMLTFIRWTHHLMKHPMCHECYMEQEESAASSAVGEQGNDANGTEQEQGDDDNDASAQGDDDNDASAQGDDDNDAEQGDDTSVSGLDDDDDAASAAAVAHRQASLSLDANDFQATQSQEVDA